MDEAPTWFKKYAAARNAQLGSLQQQNAQLNAKLDKQSAKLEEQSAKLDEQTQLIKTILKCAWYMGLPRGVEAEE